MYTPDRFIVFPAVIIKKEICQKPKIFSSFPEGRQMYLNGIYSVKQVLPEFIPVCHIHDIHVGGAYKPYVNRHGPV